jgi:hypothetical protein
MRSDECTTNDGLITLMKQNINLKETDQVTSPAAGPRCIMVGLCHGTCKWTLNNIFTDYGLDDRGSIPCRGREGICSLRLCVQDDSGVHPASYRMATGGSFAGVMRPGREADHSPLSTAEVKKVWSYTSTPQYVFTTWCIVKHRKTLPLGK